MAIKSCCKKIYRKAIEDIGLTMYLSENTQTRTQDILKELDHKVEALEATQDEPDHVWYKLDDTDFRCLVGGGRLTINCDDTKIVLCLSDIGFENMHNIIDDVDEKKDFYKNREV